MPNVARESRPRRPARPQRPPRPPGAVALALAALLAATTTMVSCARATPAATPGGRTPAKALNIVAAENFWGSIVAQLAGKAAHVTSVVSDPNADPHSYETSTDDARAFATADYVVLNGAGYDAWAAKLLSANPNAKRTVFTVAGLLGKNTGDNPHFWYQPDYVARVRDKIVSDLKRLDPAAGAYFDGQLAAFNAAMAPVNNRLGAIKARFTGTPAGATESVFVYLAQYLGLNLISPREFMQAVAAGNDPPAPAVAQLQDQITKKQVKVLVYNRQTSTAVTTNTVNLATRANLPTVGVTETIQPPDASYQEWLGAELLSLENALAGTEGAGPTTSGP